MIDMRTTHAVAHYERKLLPIVHAETHVTGIDSEQPFLERTVPQGCTASFTIITVVYRAASCAKCEC